jgi:hypothetical protein
MRYLSAILLIGLFCQTARGEEANPLKGLEGLQFSSSISAMPEIVITKERLARVGEDALKKAGILRKTSDASAYPLLSLSIHGGKKQDVVFFVWELQVKEKVTIPANKTYRRKAFEGTVTIWQSSGMMTTNPAKMELDLIAQLEKAMDAFVKKWQEANPADVSSEKAKNEKK